MFLKLWRRSRYGNEAMFVRCVLLILSSCTLLGARGYRLVADEPAVSRASRLPIQGILYNEDTSHRFLLDPRVI